MTPPDRRCHGFSMVPGTILNPYTQTLMLLLYMLELLLYMLEFCFQIRDPLS